jgi:tight adherence protein C
MMNTALLVGLLAAGGAGWVYRRRRMDDRRRKEAMADALADIADLLIVLLGAGMSVPAALRWLAERGPVPTRAAIVHVLEGLDSGQSVTASLRSIPILLGPSYQPLVATLVAAVRDGTPTGVLLLRLGDEARAGRRSQQDRLARSLPVRMLLPLVMCSLPAVIVGAVAPLVLVAIGRL